MNPLVRKIIFATPIALLGVSGSIQAQALEFGEPLREAHFQIQHMSDPSSMALSPGDQHLYVANFTDNSLLVFEREVLTGELILTETHLNNLNGVTGLAGANFTTVSPDGKTVYIASLNDHAITAFERSTSNGALTFLASYKDGTAGIDGLRWASAVKVSPDNKNVYVSGPGDNAVAVFGREQTSGSLTFIEYVKNGVNGVEGMVNPYALSISSDGKHLYVASSQNSLAVFERESATGSLVFLEAYYDNTDGINGLDGVTSLTLSENGQFLYVTAENDNSIAVFSRDESTGSLTFVEALDNSSIGLSGFLQPSFAAISAEGEKLYVGTYNNADIYAFQCDPADGTLLSLGLFQDRLEGASISLILTGDHLYRADFSAKAISLYHKEENTELFESFVSYEDNQTVAIVEGLEGANFSSLTTDGKHLYVAAYGDNSITLFHPMPDGTLKYKVTYKDDQGGIDGLKGCIAVVLSPDNKFVYGIGLSEHAFAVFSRNETDGKLEYLTSYKNNTAGITGMFSPSALACSGDGKHIYVTAMQTGGALLVFERDPATGLLTYIETQKNGVNGISGLTLRAAAYVLVSADGKFVYTASLLDNAINVFSREASTGKLTYVTAYQNGEENIVGLTGVGYMTFDSEDRFLYATSNIDNAVSLFERDETTGTLSFVTAYLNETEGIEDMLEPTSLVIHPSGEFLFVPSAGSNPVEVFMRDKVTGALTFYKSYAADGISAASFITLSNDGTHLYLTAGEDELITVASIVKIPDAPYNLNATVTQTDIELTWEIPVSPDPSFLHYTIYRHTENDPFSALAIGTTTSTSFQDVSAEEEVTYYYWITVSTTSGHESLFSAVDSARIGSITGAIYAHGKEEVRVYPNPSSGKVYLSSPGNSFSQVEVYNPAQQMIQQISGHYFQAASEIDLTLFPAGIYTIKLIGDESVRIVRVVKN